MIDLGILPFYFTLAYFIVDLNTIFDYNCDFLAISNVSWISQLTINTSILGIQISVTKEFLFLKKII